MDHPEFERRFKQYLVRSRYSQAAFARELDCHASTINKWITGVNRIPLHTLLDVCRILDLSQGETDELLRLVGYSSPWPELQSPPTVSPLDAVNKDQGWSGLVDVDRKGLELIQGYDLWFTNHASGHWWIWHLDSKSGIAAPLPFEMDEETRKLDQFVPAISPHRDEISFSAGQLVAPGAYSRNLYLADLSGANVRQLTASCLDHYHPSWSATRRQVAYSAGSHGNPCCPDQGYGIWILDLTNGEQRQLTDGGDYDPAWSPDGKYIAFHSKAASWNIVVMVLASGHRPVNEYDTWIAADVGAIASGPSWVNQNRVVFSTKLERHWQIFATPVMPFHKFVRPSQLTNNDWDSLFPTVFDGRLMMWQAYRHEPYGDEGPDTDKIAVLYVMDLNTRRYAPLITGVGNARNGVLHRRR